MSHSKPARRITPSANAAAATSLRRRLARAQTWFYVSLCALGVGVPVAAVGLLLLLSDPLGSAPPIVILAGIVVACVGLGGLLLMASDRSSYKRSLGVVAQADRMGFHFTEHPPEEDYSWLRSLRVFSYADADAAANLLTGQIDGATVVALDYTDSYRGASGRVEKIYSQTVVAVLGSPDDWPNFLLSPKGWLDAVSQFLGDRLIELPGRREFNRRVALRAEDDRITAYFTPELVNLCLSKDRLVVEAQSELLVVFRTDRLAAPQEYPELIAFALQLADALRRRNRGGS
jgi:hypothetical protein